MNTRREVLLLSVAFAACPFEIVAGLRPDRHAQQPARRIVIHSPPLDTLGDYGLGVRLGATEAERATMLLGHDFALVHDGPALARVAPVAPPSSDVPVVAMSTVGARDCVFVTMSSSVPSVSASEAPATDASIVDWHHEFSRYGAGELNERFARAFNKPMTAQAWHGWVAVKAIVEAAIRGGDVCLELSRLRFDGHKGRALRFDPNTRQLQHPKLTVRKQGERLIVEVVR